MDAGFGRYRALVDCFVWQNPATRDPRPVIAPAGIELVELVLGGRGWIEDGGAWHEVGAGHLLWHAPGEGTIGRSDRADPYRCLALHLAVDGSPRPAPRRSRWEDLAQVRAFADETVRLHRERRVDAQALLGFVAGTLVLRARVGSDPTARLPAPLVRALRLIERAPRAAPSVPALARAVGWSERTLHRAFRAHLGTTPHGWLTDRRLDLARRAIAAQRPIAAVAAECGFADAAHLGRVFSARVGSTPGAWRRRHGHAP